MGDRLAGLLIFLPVPVVLFLFTRMPLGLPASLGLGILVMLTHRLYARPFARGRAARRCLWCGGTAGDGPALSIREPLGPAEWRACGAADAERLARVLGWADRRRHALRAGILGSLVLFLLGAPLAAAGRLGPAEVPDLVALFRLGIAATVLPLALLGPRAPASDALSSPFPLHIQALIGTGAVLWLFRLVGLAWLALAVVRLAG